MCVCVYRYIAKSPLKTLNIISHQGNANEKHNGIPLCANWNSSHERNSRFQVPMTAWDTGTLVRSKQYGAFGKQFKPRDLATPLLGIHQEK